VWWKERLSQIWRDWLETELLLANGPRTRRCKAIGTDKEEEEEEEVNYEGLQRN
jgi:hypothetical protein